MDPKKMKSSRNRDEEEEINHLDRLSCLPDSILTHIVSFLDTKTSIRTSVLSKRYKLLWTLSPCLDFKLSDYHTDSLEAYDEHTAAFPQIRNYSVSSFESYVNHVLQCREHTNLTMFSLLLHKDVGLDLVQSCIDYAAQHKVQNLKLRGYVKRKPVVLPKLLLTSSSLVALHLHNAISFCIELPKSVALSNLKILRLKNFEFSDRNFNGELFLGCPNLETLVLSKCCIRPGNKMKMLDLNCLNLKNLEIRYWRSPWKCFDEQMINVSATGLSFFKLQGHLVRVNFMDDLPRLNKACIDLCYPTSCSVVNATERKQRTSEVFLNILRDMCNVKSLSLSLKTLEVLCTLPDLRLRSPTVFGNLKFIKFTSENKYREKTMPIETVMRLLEEFACDVLVLDGSKEQTLTPGCSNVKCKHKDDRHIAIPVDVVHFLLENSPSAEFLSIETSKVSSDQE